MNFSSMDYFVMVARERSFSRAAERLHITQQTLSAHIAKRGSWGPSCWCAASPWS